MLNNLKIFLFLIFMGVICINFNAKGDVIKKIDVTGNERISTETIILFAATNIDEKINEKKINDILKSLYETNFFKNVEIAFEKNILRINVLEFPIINELLFEGVKSKTILATIKNNLQLKTRSSMNDIFIRKDKDKILNDLKNLGYYFAKVEVYTEDLNDNKVNIKYIIKLGNKAKIKKINFIGNKIFKYNKLRSVIVSEEYKFWKVISGKKYLNEDIIRLDNRLLKNFYLNKGYYDVEINSSFAKLVSKDEFELTFNINPKKKFYFNELKLEVPDDFDEYNYSDLEKLFIKTKGEPYSLNVVEKILNKIDLISVNEQYETIKATVIEDIISDKINLNFKIDKVDTFFVDRINIFGNTITRESVIRNQLEIDEGDPFNEILHAKSINNLKSLNFFKNVSSEIIDVPLTDNKVINISLEEKATGEISAGAGVGTSGSTIMFGVKENNYLGKGISLDTNVTVSEESIKGIFSVINPNFNNTDKSVYTTFQADELDQLTNYGYKSNKIGFDIGTNFEYLNDLKLGLGTSSFYEEIETNSTASARQKKQSGNYWDTFVSLNFDYDKRNQKFRTSDGSRSYYSLSIPIISETNTLTNSLSYKSYNELYENNITTASFLLKSAISLTNDDIKLSERLTVPSRRLKGFENGKVGPKDQGDYIGGNYLTAFNLTTTLPQILPNAQNTDFLIFFDAANIWGVDYDSSLGDSSKIRSSIGIGVDYFTPIGPLNFSLSQVLSKADSDKTESFRFNLGTTF